MTNEELEALKEEMAAMDAALFKLSEDAFAYVTGEEEEGFVPDEKLIALRKRNDILNEKMSELSADEFEKICR